MSRRRGMTLIELLLALMILAMLMVGVLAVVMNLGARGQAGGDPRTAGSDPAATVDAWVRQLRQDLACGDIEAVHENELSLIGYMALEGADRRRTHRPVRVVYRIEDLGGRVWVVRRQAMLDVMTNQGVSRDLVCSGVARFEFVRTIGAAAVEVPAGTWRLRVWTRDQEAPSHDVFVLAERGGGV